MADPLAVEFGREARRTALGTDSPPEGDNEKLAGSQHDFLAAEVPPKPKWYRSVFFQMTILGICCFLCPGIWNAMSTTGGGGQQSVSLVNASTSSTYSLMFFTGLLTPVLMCATSVRFTLVLGTLGFAPYVAALYLHGKNGTEWFVIFGAVLCGITAGIFFATEGSVALSYPIRSKQGIYISYWLMYRVFGQLLGGAINLGLNASNNARGSMSNDTYVVFVVLQCIAPLFALMISQPNQVQRSDGTPVIMHLSRTPLIELRALLKTLLKPHVLLLQPLIFQSGFGEALLGTYLADHFTVRVRALGSLLAAIVGATGNYILGFYLDNQRTSINFRAKSSFGAVYIMQLAWWAFGIYMMNYLHDNKNAIDWDEGIFHKAFACYILLQLGFNLMYEYNYWIVGASNDEPADIVRLASILRATESAGQAVAYGINSTNLRLDATGGINIALCFCSIPLAWFIVRKTGILPDGTRLVKPPFYADSEEQRAELVRTGVISESDAKGTA